MKFKNVEKFTNQMLKALEDNTMFLSNRLEKYCDLKNDKFVYELFKSSNIYTFELYAVFNKEGVVLYDNKGKLYEFFVKHSYNNKYSFYYDFVVSLKKYNNMIVDDLNKEEREEV